MIRRIGFFAVLNAAGLLIAAPNCASAATTIGSNLAASTGTNIGCGPACTFGQATLPAGSQAPGGMLAPSDGVVVRWRIKVGSLTSPAALRITRPGGSNTRTGGGTGPTENPPANMTSTFDVRLPIRIGDALGVDCCAAASSVFANTAPAGTESWNPRLQDGEPARFGSGLGGIELLINADIEADADQDGFGDETQDQCLGAAGPQNGCPSNAFTLGAITHDKSKGTATLNLTLPNPGELSGSGNGAKVASARAVTSKSVGAIQAQLLVKAKGKKKRKLNETGKVKLTVAVTYTPTGGKPATQSVKVKLKKI